MKYQVQQLPSDPCSGDIKCYVDISGSHSHDLIVSRSRSLDGNWWGQAVIDLHIFNLTDLPLSVLWDLRTAESVMILWNLEPDRKEFEI